MQEIAQMHGEELDRVNELTDFLSKKYGKNTEGQKWNVQKWTNLSSS